MAVTFGRGEFGVGSPLAGFQRDGWFVWGASLMVAPIRYIGEYTLELRNQSAHGIINGLTG